MIRGEPGELLTEDRAQRAERDRLGQLVRCSRGEGKAQLGCLLGGVAEQPGLADARLTVHEDHAARPPLSAPQQVTDDLLLGVASEQDLPAGRSLPRRYPAACIRGGVTDHRGHGCLTLRLDEVLAAVDRDGRPGQVSVGQDRQRHRRDVVGGADAAGGSGRGPGLEQRGLPFVSKGVVGAGPLPRSGGSVTGSGGTSSK